MWHAFAIAILICILQFQARHMLRRGFSSKYTAGTAPTTKMFIDGKFVDSKATEWIDLHDPATNEIVTRVPKCTQEEMLGAVESAKKAFKVRIPKHMCTAIAAKRTANTFSAPA